MTRQIVMTIAMVTVGLAAGACWRITDLERSQERRREPMR